MCDRPDEERRAQDMHQIGKRIEPPGAARRVPEAGVLEQFVRQDRGLALGRNRDVRVSADFSHVIPPAHLDAQVRAVQARSNRPWLKPSKLKEPDAGLQSAVARHWGAAPRTAIA